MDTLRIFTATSLTLCIFIFLAAAFARPNRVLSAHYDYLPGENLLTHNNWNAYPHSVVVLWTIISFLTGAAVFAALFAR